MKAFPVIILILLLLSACGDDPHIRHVLDDADRMVMAMPDSAIAMLETLDISGASASGKARHALLLTKARRKLHIIETDDSLIRTAVDYYRGRGDSLETQSLFYNGVILRFRKEYPNALILLMEACDKASDIGDDFYRAMACREQASIYTDLCNYDRAAELGRDAAKAFDKAGRPLHAAWERVYIPQSLAYSGRIDEAYDSIGALASDSIILSDPELRKHFYFIACNVCYMKKDYAQSEKYYNDLVQTGDIPSSKLLSQMAKLKLDKGEGIEAKEYWRRAIEQQEDESDSLAALWALTEIYKSEGDYKNAYLSLESLTDGETRLTDTLITHPYTALLNNYFRKEAIHKSMLLEESSRRTRVWISVCVGLLIFIAVSVYIYRQRLRQKELERDLIIRDLNALEARISEISSTSNSVTEDDARDSDQFLLGMLKSICDRLSTYGLRNDETRKFRIKVSEMLTCDENLLALEGYIDRNYDNLMSRFRHQAESLSEHQYRIAAFLFLGFSDTTIASLFNTSAPAVRQLRYRIRKRIRENHVPDSDLFLRFF